MIIDSPIVKSAEKLADYIESSEDLLMKRILDYAIEFDYAQYTSTLEEPWRLSIQMLSQPMARELRGNKIKQISASAQINDEITEFGRIEAKRHRERGVDLQMFLGLYKYYRESYLDIVKDGDFDSEELESAQTYIRQYFDRIEMAFCVEWANVGDVEALKELQDKNKSLTNLKNKYLTIFESLYTPALLLTPDGQVSAFNTSAKETFPHIKSHEEGQNPYSTNPQTLISDLAPIIDQFLKTKKSHHQLVSKFNTNKGVREFTINIKKMVDVSKKFQGITVIFSDITHVRKIEDELQLKDRALASAANGVVLTDHKGEIVWVNQAFTQITGYSSYEVIGKNPNVLKSGKSSPEFYQNLWSKISSGQTWRWEFINQHKDGHEYAEEALIAPIKDADNNITHYVCIKQDITAQKKIQDALKQSQEQFRQLISGLPDAVLVVADGSILFCNYSFCKLVNAATADSPVNSQISNYFQEDLEDLESMVGVFSHHQIHHIKSNTGESREVEVFVSHINWDDRECYQIILRDMHERLFLEAQLRQAQKLESIGQLAAGIAHEINTPTQFVGDNLQFIQKGITRISETMNDAVDLIDKWHEKSDDASEDEIYTDFKTKYKKKKLSFLLDELPDAIEQSCDGVERIGKIVRSMKEFSHPAGKSMCGVDINHALENTVSVARNEWKYVSDVEFNLEPGLSAVECLQAEMNQVFLNLIVNAAQAIEGVVTEGSGKGKITIETKTEDTLCVITVSDTGTGMSNEIQSKIFDPFFTTKPVGKGTGQGLAITYDVIVSKHGGELSVDSKPGKGSTFTIKIPFSQNKRSL